MSKGGMEERNEVKFSVFWITRVERRLRSTNPRGLVAITNITNVKLI